MLVKMKEAMTPPPGNDVSQAEDDDTATDVTAAAEAAAEPKAKAARLSKNLAAMRRAAFR